MASTPPHPLRVLVCDPIVTLPCITRENVGTVFLINAKSKYLTERTLRKKIMKKKENVQLKSKMLSKTASQYGGNLS